MDSLQYQNHMTKEQFDLDMDMNLDDFDTLPLDRYSLPDQDGTLAVTPKVSSEVSSELIHAYK
jgi:hypothetical protein